MSAKTIAYTELASAMVLVGSSVVVGKLIVEIFPVFLALTLRLLIGLPILLMLTYRTRYELVALKPYDWMMLFWQSFTGVFLFNVLLLYALNYTSAAASGIITSMTPMVIALIAWLFLKEPLSLKINIGILFTVMGILAINLVGNTKGMLRGSSPLFGNLLVGFAVLSEALFTIFRKVTAHRVSPLMSATVVTFIGLLCFLPMGAYEAIRFDFAEVSCKGYLYIVYYGVGVTVIAYLLWFGGVGKVPASTSAIFTGILPMSAVIFSVIFLGEEITTAYWFGLACVLAGVGMISLHQSD